MSHEGGPEPTQRTVAELLAKYGQESGERAPRRRRRRADDVEDTGAQAIIERVMSESGEMPVIRDDTPPPGRTSHRANRTDFQRPVEPPPRRRQPPPPPPSPGPPTVATPPVTGPPSIGRMPAVGPPSSGRLPVAGPPSSNRLPVVGPPGELPRRDRPAPPPPNRRVPEPPRRQPSQQLPVPPPGQSQPLPKPQQQPSQQLRQPGPPPGQRSGIQPSLRSRLDGGDPPPPTQTMSPALSPPVKPGPPPEPMTEELPRVPTYPEMDPVAGRHPGQDSRTRLTPPVLPPHEQFPSGQQPRVPDRDFDPDFEQGDYRDNDYRDNDYDNYGDNYGDNHRGTFERGDLDRGDYPGGPDTGFERGFERGDDDRDRDRDRELDRDLDDELARELDELDGEREPRSAAREWLVMVGQLAVGVLGGAAVWLGFNWLWGALPQAALVLALAVIAGMVFIVRKIRKAEDLQTTVYAVLVGLLATVSPAALLLLNR